MSLHPRRSAADRAVLEIARKAANASLGDITWFQRDLVIDYCADFVKAEGHLELAEKVRALKGQSDAAGR